MIKKAYEVIEHTADIGIRAKAKTLKSLFKACALAVFDLSVEEKPFRLLPEKKFNLKIEAGSREELLHDWLNEVISLSQAKGVIFTGFNIKKVSEYFIEAEGIGKDVSYFKVNTEIKAATYHCLKVARRRAGWIAEVILDV